MDHASRAARASRATPTATIAAPMARATRFPDGARRSAVVAAVTRAIARNPSRQPPAARHASAAIAAAQTEAQPVTEGAAGICLDHVAAGRAFAAAREVVRFPARQLQRAGDQHDGAGRTRNGARHQRKPHFDGCERQAETRLLPAPSTRRSNRCSPRRSAGQVDPETGAILRTIESNRFVTGVTWLDGELWHATWEGDESDLRRVDHRTGKVLERLEMPAGVNISGIESDGRDQFFCGGGKTGKIRTVRRPRSRSARGTVAKGQARSAHK